MQTFITNKEESKEQMHSISVPDQHSNYFAFNITRLVFSVDVFFKGKIKNLVPLRRLPASALVNDAQICMQICVAHAYDVLPLTAILKNVTLVCVV